RLTGRDFERADTLDSPGVAIVSRRFAQQFWHRTDVIGERTTPLFPQSDAFWIPRTIRRPLTIVGVVEDVREDGIPGHPDDRAPQLYLPYSQNPTRIMTVVTRPHGVPASAAPCSWRSSDRQSASCWRRWSSPSNGRGFRELTGFIRSRSPLWSRCWSRCALWQQPSLPTAPRTRSRSVFDRSAGLVPNLG